MGRAEVGSAAGGFTPGQRDYSEGTEILSAGFVDFAVDVQSPIGIGEPPKIQPIAKVGHDLVSDSWDSDGETESPAQVSAKLRSLSQRYVESEQDQLSVRDVVALGLAAVIGIACGLVFLRMVSPSLLAGINF
jgi:hypothetical protein